MTIRFVRKALDGCQIYDTDLCERNLNLLAHAQAIELEIDSQCGGHGICGGDRVRTQTSSEQFSAVTAAEREHLTSEMLAQGWRLACQCFPQSSGAELDIQLPARAL